MSTHTESSEILPLLPMREDVIYPGDTAPFYIGRKASMEAVEQALNKDRRIFVVTQRETQVENPEQSDLYQIGVIGQVLQIMRLPNGTLKALFEAKQRARLNEARMDGVYYMGVVAAITETISKENTATLKESANALRKVAKAAAQELRKRNEDFDMDSLLSAPAKELADRVASLLNVSSSVQQAILEILDPLKRLEQVTNEVEQMVQVREMENRLKEQVRQSIGSNRKDAFLNEQLRNIQRELGHGDDSRDDFAVLETRIEKAKMPKPAHDTAIKELKKLKLMSPMSAEANVGRNYLDWLLSLPWVDDASNEVDLNKAQEMLDADHYALEKVKERIIEYIAVCKLQKAIKGPILCFTGPPGVGKTSLAKSIANALGRSFARMSLGGIRDEAEIRGHRRTYIGAMPGKIIQAMKKAKSKNAVILMDEIDKLYHSVMGDPSAALLEVLDPEQNKSFMDHYIEVEYDLSSVLFICTANSTQHITAPLLDRMEVVTLPGYTELEKGAIAVKHLIPKQLKSHGLENEDVCISKNVVSELIRRYTREPGVRALEREIGKILRKITTQMMKKEDKKPKAMNVSLRTLEKHLGAPRYKLQQIEDHDAIGFTNGLGVTEGGGELLVTEVGIMPGTGKFSTTGQLGDVMKESVDIANSYVRSRADSLGIFTSSLKKLDIHVHLPENAVPKDGPSAGITLITSLMSALTSIPVHKDIALTGEVTLRGHVLEVGGIKEKLLAALRAGISTVIMPRANEKDMDDVPLEVKKNLKILMVETMDEVTEIALLHKPTPLTPKEIEEDQAKLDKMAAQNSDKSAHVA